MHSTHMLAIQKENPFCFQGFSQNFILCLQSEQFSKFNCFSVVKGIKIKKYRGFG